VGEIRGEAMRRKRGREKREKREGGKRKGRGRGREGKKRGNVLSFLLSPSSFSCIRY
jgi:hypothetical protein